MEGLEKKMNRGWVCFGALMGSLLLFGCGGGGGKRPASSGTGTLAIMVDGDAGSSAGPTGTVHTLAVYRSDGTKVDKQSVNLSAGSKVVTFNGLPTGTLRLHVGLSAAPGGAEVGSIDRTFEGGVAADPIQVEMAQPVQTVEVSPPAATVATGSTTPVYAAGRSGDGGYVYTAPNGWSYSVADTATATVDASGTVSGVAQGSTSVRATHLASGAFGTGAIGVFSDAVVQGKWTIMVYMDAANDLFPFAVKNLNQMEAIANNPNVRFVVQWKQVQGLDGNDNPLFSGTRRYLAQYDSTNVNDFDNAIKSTVVKDLGAGVDMASSTELKSFVDWTKAKYPADHYALILWSHGNGWFSRRASALSPVPPRAIIRDNETNNELAFPDVRRALDDGSLDILGYDACLMQGAESLLEFASKTKYIVGSEDNVPGTGLPYNIVFKPFVDRPDAPEADLAAGIANEFVNTYKNSNAGFPIHMSVLDTSRAGAVAAALDGLGQALLDGGATTGASMRALRASAQQIEPHDGYFFYDLDQIAALMIARPALGTSVQSAATLLKAALGEAVLTNEGSSDAANFKGLSIEFSTSGTINNSLSGYAQGYNRLQLSALTHWNEFLESSTANP